MAMAFYLRYIKTLWVNNLMPEWVHVLQQLWQNIALGHARCDNGLVLFILRHCTSKFIRKACREDKDVWRRKQAKWLKTLECYSYDTDCHGFYLFKIFSFPSFLHSSIHPKHLVILFICSDYHLSFILLSTYFFMSIVEWILCTRT